MRIYTFSHCLQLLERKSHLRSKETLIMAHGFRAEIGQTITPSSRV